MSSNVIAQQDGKGVFTFTNIDNKYGGATTELLKLEEGKVTFGVKTVPSSKVLTLAAGDTAASLELDKDVVFISNANTSSATVTVAAGTEVGATVQVVCTGTGEVVFSGVTGFGGGLTVTGKGGVTLVCGPDLVWYQVGLAA